MKQKYKGNLKKGDLVHLISSRGNHLGTPDFSITFKIRSIGTKMSVVDRIDPATGTKLNYTGRSFHLFSEEEAERRARSGWNTWNPINWSMVFFPAGAEPGWDPLINV